MLVPKGGSQVWWQLLSRGKSASLVAQTRFYMLAELDTLIHGGIPAEWTGMLANLK